MIKHYNHRGKPTLMVNPDYKHINSGRLVQLADKIAWLEDEFKVSRRIGQTDRAELIEIALGENYRKLMHEVKKQGLKSIDLTPEKVKVTFKRTLVTNRVVIL